MNAPNAPIKPAVENTQEPTQEPTQDTPVEKPAVAASMPQSETVKFETHERVPSDWEIIEVEGDLIEAYNIKTAKRVVTDRKTFSAALRGK